MVCRHERDRGGRRGSIEPCSRPWRGSETECTITAPMYHSTKLPRRKARTMGVRERKKPWTVSRVELPREWLKDTRRVLRAF